MAAAGSVSARRNVMAPAPTSPCICARMPRNILTSHALPILCANIWTILPSPFSGFGKDGDREQLNSSTALWTRPAKEVSTEEYQNFYASVSSAYDTPFATLHNRTEGAVEFTNLLFIPSAAPFDLYDPERKSRLRFTSTGSHH